jgi:hypothetical protein
MIKHVGKHNNKKIVVLWRKVPGEDHMALLCYSDTLPRMIHDEVMRALESAIGQNAKDFSDVLFRTVMGDGRNALEVLHKEGMIKKVPTSQVLITPTAKSSVRLDELNNILDQMDKGEEAIKKMADLDSNSGLQTKKRVREGREVGMPPNNSSVSRTNIDVEATDSAAAYLKGTFSDSDLIEQRLSQAQQMQKQAEQLLAEAKRLTEEAQQLSPVKNGTRKTKKATAPKQQAT